MKEFKDLFQFNPQNVLKVGIEREGFLTQHGEIVPVAPKVLKHLKCKNRFGYELSACQLEDRTPPSNLADISQELRNNSSEISKVLQCLGYGVSYIDVAPQSMPLDVYPDPQGRYQRIAEKLSPEILEAACRVAAIHVHIGMPNHELALEAYNNAIQHVQMLTEKGDLSKGKRMAMYQKMAPDFIPPHYKNWDEFEGHSKEKGYSVSPRECYHLIRISIHGTIEFRMFGSTPDLKRILEWATLCHELCAGALNEKPSVV